MLLAFAYSISTSFLFGLVIISTVRWHGSISHDNGTTLQAIHVAPVPRVGGIPIYLSLSFSFLFIHLLWGGSVLDLSLQLKSFLALLAVMLIAVTPIFGVGLAEDITKKVSPQIRFWVSISSGIAGCLFLESSVTNLGFAYINLILTIPLVAILFTGFATAGVANAFNMIDGLNGLAILVALQILLGLGILAYINADSLLLVVSATIAGSLCGLLLLNWPLGKIFLGDGGAYLTGFLIAWICVLLNERHQLISSYAFLMLCAYPVTEVLYSSWRRVRRKAKSSIADSFHLHQLIYRQVVCKVVKNGGPKSKNSIAGLLCSLISIPPVVFAVLNYQHQTTLIFGFIGFVFLYAVGYQKLLSWELASDKSAPNSR